MGSDDGALTGGDDGHAPVTVDPPRGKGEATWWPAVVVLGVVGIYVGVGLGIIARRPNPLVDPVVGPVVFLCGLGVFLAGVAGWTYHGFVYRYWERAMPTAVDRFRWGAILFICAEVATFAGAFAYYGYLRVGPWPPGHLPALLSSLVAVNTALLVTSSATLHLAHGALRTGRRRRFVGLLGLTVLLGAVFLVGQGWEYYAFIVREDFTVARGAFASAFYGLTGLHGLHVAMGVVLLSVILARAALGQYDADRHASVRTATLYWHFVDTVWLVLVATLYVGATVTL